MASIFGVDPLKFAHVDGPEILLSGFDMVDGEGAFTVPHGVILRPMIGAGGKLWSCGRPGQMRCIGLTPEAAYKSWSRMQ